MRLSEGDSGGAPWDNALGFSMHYAVYTIYCTKKQKSIIFKARFLRNVKRMRAQVLKQNQFLIQKLHFLFMERGRIRLTQIISGALKLKTTKFFMNFRRICLIRTPYVI